MKNFIIRLKTAWFFLTQRNASYVLIWVSDENIKAVDAGEDTEIDMMFHGLPNNVMHRIFNNKSTIL